MELVCPLCHKVFDSETGLLVERLKHLRVEYTTDIKVCKNCKEAEEENQWP